MHIRFVLPASVVLAFWLSLSAQVHFSWRNPLPTGADLSNVAFIHNRFIATGSGGTLLASTNGTAWVGQNSGTESALFGSTWGDGKYVVVGAGGAIVATADSATWKVQNPVTGSKLLSVAFGSGRFIAVGEHGTIISSPDGVAWAVEHSTGPSLNTVVFGDGKFIAGGAEGRIIVSTDGHNWSEVLTRAGTIASITFAHGVFLAAGDGALLRSTDGVTWVRIESVLPPLPFSLATDRKAFYALKYDGVLSSTDGESWSLERLKSGKGLTSIANGKLRTVVVGSGGMIRYSDDQGKSWMRADTRMIPDTRLGGIVFGNGLFVIVGNGGIYTSTDGVAWHEVAGIIGQPDLRTLIYANKTFVAVGANGAVFSSRDGLKWKSTSPGTGIDFISIAYGNGRFAAWGLRPGQRCAMFTSDNGYSWSMGIDMGAVRLPSSLAFGNGVFVGASGNGVVYTSTDGDNWTPRKTGVTSDLSGLAFGLGRFIAVSGDGTAVISTDGIEWSATAAVPLKSIVWGHNRFLGLGYPDVVSSPDGQVWTRLGAVPNVNLHAAAFGNGEFIVVGENGAVVGIR